MSVPSSGKVVDINPQTEGLANNASVTSFTDDAGVAFTGSCTNKTGQATDKAAFSFNGSSHYLQSSSALDLSGTNKITVCAFLKFTNSTQGCVLEHSANYNSNTGFTIFSGSGDYAVIAGASDPALFSIYTTNETLDHYKTLIYTHDRSLSSGEIAIRIGDADASGAYDSNQNLTGNFASQTLYIGARGGSSSFQAFDLVRLIIYNRALTSGEIAQVEADFFGNYQPVITTTLSPLSPQGVVGEAYSKSLAHTGGAGQTVTFSKSGTSPAGLSFSSAGVFTGSPTTATTYNWFTQILVGGSQVGDSYVTQLVVTAAPKLKWTAFRMVNIPASVVAARYFDVAADSTGVTLADGAALFVRYFGLGHGSAGTSEMFVVTLSSYVPSTTANVYEYLVAKRQGSTIYLRDGRTISF